jgi:heptosyltransferase-2
MSRRSPASLANRARRRGGAPGSAPERAPDAALARAERIVVRAPNWLGDVVMATPGLRALRKHAPSAHITVQLPDSLAPLLEGSPHVDAIVAMAGRPHGLRALWREARRLRAAGPFDYGVCLPESHSSALIMRAAGVRRIGGYARSGRGVWLHDPIEAPPEWGRRRMVAREIFVTTLLEGLGCPGDGSRLELTATAAAEREADRLLAPLGAARSIVGLAPGASFGPSKRWPESSFADLADRFVGGGDAVVLIGSATERELIERIRARMRTSAVSLAGRTPLGVLPALMRRLSLLVCNDAGARHVAVACGVPTTVFMGPTALEKTGENLERVAVLTHDVPCRPCYQRHCPIDHGCMTGIGVERAWEAASGLRSPGHAASQPQGIERQEWARR